MQFSKKLLLTLGFIGSALFWAQGTQAKTIQWEGQHLFAPVATDDYLNIQVRYTATVTNTTTGQNITDGGNVSVGDTLQINMAPFNNGDIIWYPRDNSGVGYVPYASMEPRTGFFLPDAGVPSVSCDASQRAYMYTSGGICIGHAFYGSGGGDGGGTCFGGGGTYYIYTPVSVNPPSISYTHSGSAGLSCNADGSSCTVQSAGSISFGAVTSSTFGKINSYRDQYGCFPYYSDASYADGPAQQFLIDGQSISFSLTAVGNNTAPQNITVNGPTSGNPNTSYSFNLTATDPEGDTLRYGIDWNNDGAIDQWVPGSGYVASGTTQTASYTWTTPGTYTFQVLAQDSKGGQSGWVSHTIVIANPAPPVDPTCQSVQWDIDSWVRFTPTGGEVPQCNNYNIADKLCSQIGVANGACTLKDVNYVENTGARCEVTATACPNTVTPPAPTINFTINGSTGPLTVTQGSPLNLNWDTTGATSCMAWGASWATGTAIPLTGSTSFPANQSDTYIIQCTGPGGTTTSSIQVIIQNTLKICQNSCNSGATRGTTTNTGSFTLTQGGTQNLVACFNSATGCTDPSGDVTASATWNENTSSSVISLSGGTPKTVTAGTAGNENISVTYNGQTASTQATVTCVPTYTQSSCATHPEAQKHCQNEGFTIPDNGCGVPVSCTGGTKTCDFNWKEVAP